MRTIETRNTVYQYDELTDEAKERAREWYRRACDGDDYWQESVIEDAETCAKILGIEIDQRQVKRMDGKYNEHPKIWFSGFSSQGDGACFEGRYQYRKGAAKAIRQHAGDPELWAIADALQDAQRGVLYSARARMQHSGHYVHSGCMAVSVECERGGDEARGEAESVIEQCMRDFADWIYKQLETEYDYQNSDEQVDEMIRANEYEFEEDGTRAGW